MDNKYFTSESVELLRSQINLHEKNPRTIPEENRKALKRGIKKFGMVGGIVVNKRTNYTLVSGHQRLSVMDELQKYNPDTKNNDYTIRVDLIDVEEKEEKELLILLNNPSAQGEWDYDTLRELIPDIDYKDAGLTEQDLDIIGVDFNFQTEEENAITTELDDLMAPVHEEHQAEVAQRQAERAEKVAHMKQVKEEVKQAATKAAANMDAYLMLSFDTWDAKAEFCEKFGFNPDEKFLKGEIFSEKIETLLTE
ncbi:ParB N-terminal domain-containing protein [Hoylesella shahii]|uniref:ParB-like nuclease family protein n=1 Tax=Hoylesella shahii DSM 15611 = JCM 12083 TaxID=1122991 RepID=A0A318I374_9BACT|nr:ParB N-terminal domain-containing protein [Hoylesella shahii]PXX23600.1 ParB-like nuclease family protein [Hoylesella shahii DSM 15611 = JCM 12083]